MQLTAKHFTIIETKVTENKGRNLAHPGSEPESSTRKILAIKIKEPLVLLIYSPTCPHCVLVGPIFAAIEQNAPFFKFGVLNAKQEKLVSGESLKTTTPIKAVPMIIAYNGGKPISIFSGPRTRDNLMNFLDKTRDIILHGPPRIQTPSQLPYADEKTYNTDFTTDTIALARQREAERPGIQTGSAPSPVQTQTTGSNDLASYATPTGIPHNISCNESGQCYLTFGQAYGSDSMNVVPDQCYLTFDQCYGPDCPTNS